MKHPMKHPNILLICGDEMRGDAMGYAGNPFVKTPNLDRLAGEGAMWKRCFATQPTCTPSRASFLTGCHSSVLRSRMVGCWTPDDPRFLAHSFHAAGYHTASIGKIHLVPQRDEVEWMQRRMHADGHYFGFREVDLVNGHGDNCFGPGYSPWLEERCPDWNERRHSRRPLREGLKPCYEWSLTPETHSGNYLVEKTMEFFGRPHDKPFFLKVSFADPHHPFTVPESYRRMYDPRKMPPPKTGAIGNGATQPSLIGTKSDCEDYSTEDWQVIKATYYGMITQLDAQVGEILASLEERGLAEETIVVFLSDHGDYLGDHQMYGKGHCYEGDTRVPLIVRGPGIQPGTKIAGIGSLLDLAPTLLDLAGVPEPEGVQGISQKAALAGDVSRLRKTALIENDDDRAPARMRTLVTEDWKLTVFAGSQNGRLFHYSSDPEELNNRWNDPDCESIQRTLERRLLEEVVLAADPANGRKQSPAPAIPKLPPAQPIPSPVAMQAFEAKPSNI